MTTTEKIANLTAKIAIFEGRQWERQASAAGLQAEIDRDAPRIAEAKERLAELIRLEAEEHHTPAAPAKES